MSLSLFGLLALVSAVMAQTQNCVLEVPPNPLTAQGLATPYKMSGCDQTQFATEACFVEAAILDPATGAIQIYNPLIINQNSTRAGFDFITPIVPTLPDNAVVGIFFGSNAVTLTLTGDTSTCVNGDANGVFGQFAYCNTPAFFSAAFSAVSSGLIKIPPPGTSTKGTAQACPVTRDFRMVDMDQSDNVDSTYLLINGHILAQNTPANAKKYSNATEFNNGSDNLLLNAFLSPTLGCTAGTFEAPCITCASGSSAAMALNELQSQFFVPTRGPALVPLNDDFTVDAGNNGTVEQSLIKTNLYRAGVGQPQAADAANASSVTYCTRYAASGIFIALNEELFTDATSPAPAASNNLFTFMANRFATSFGPVPALGCQTIFGIDSPVNQTTDGNGVVIAATINTQVLQDILDGKILPLGQTSTSTSTTSVNTVSSTSSVSLSTSTLLNVNVDSTTSSLSTSTTTTSALSTTTSISSTSTTTVLVEVVSFFIFVLNLGGVTPGVTGSIGSFVVLEEIFVDLPGAASAACKHQFNSCASLAGSAFSGTDCLNQLNSCNGVASTASPTASTPGTTTATATVPATTSSSPAIATGAPQNNNNADAIAPATDASANCPAVPPLTVSSCTASATSTVTVTVSAGSGVASATGSAHRHIHSHLRHRAAEALKPTIQPHWRA